MAVGHVIPLVLDEPRPGVSVDARDWLEVFPRAAAAEPIAGFHLRLHDDVLRLCRDDDIRGVWVPVAEVERRIRGRFLLGKACGVRPGAALKVLDATAGLGIDALALALAGQKVDLVEREPALWALIQDLLKRLQSPQPGASANVGKLVLGDTGSLLRCATAPVADVIYLDPMFPPRAKSALPGKRMQYLAQLLAGAQPFDPELVDLARSRARWRVVLKRRLRDPSYGEPDWSIRGRAIRYDVYTACP